MNSPPKEKKEEITPPNSFTSKPPTPKSLPKNRRPLPGAIVDIIQLFKNIQRGVDTDRSPWRTYHLTPEDYEELVHLLEQDEHLWGYVEDKIRFDYSPGEQKLIVRMPSELHDTFARQVDVCIENQLAQLRDGTDAVARFALAIVSQGNADTWLMDKDDKKKRHKRSPDGRFRHLGAKFPGVIMEISYSQKRKDLPVLAHDYIKGSRGHIRVVVGLDLEYRKPSSSLQSRQATVSVWRAEIIHPDNKKKLIARKVVDNEPFRDDQGNPTGEGLRLHLSEFTRSSLAEKELGSEDRDIVVSANQLCRILETAEQADGSPPPMESSSSEAAMSPLPSTPPESLRPEDEDQWSKAEDRAEKRAEKEDEDFPPPKRHCA